MESISKEYFQLPEDQTVRMFRNEFTAMKWLYSALNSMLCGSEDLKERLKMIPDGAERFRKTLDDMTALVNDLTGTMPEKQKQKVRTFMRDNEFRIVPKWTAKDVKVVLEKDDAKMLFDAAMEAKCGPCLMDGEECKKCKLYNMLIAETPLKSYGTGALCPYNLATWED